jgi:small subunit ribosomal protein S8
MTDPISDMLARIRNAGMARHPSLKVPSSKLKLAVARVLAEAGYIASVGVEAEGVEVLAPDVPVLGVCLGRPVVAVYQSQRIQSANLRKMCRLPGSTTPAPL